MNLTRREVLASALGLGTLTAVSGTASADHASAKQRDTTISADSEWLSTYAPMLDLSDVPSANHPTLYGWKVANPNQDLTVGVYVTKYAQQRATWTFTSHPGDHEWILVFVDDRGEVDHTSYSMFHWLRAFELEPTVYDEDGGHHPVFRPAKKFHHLIPQDSVPDSGVLLDVSSLGDYESQSGPLFDALDSGLEKDMESGSVHHPWALAASGGQSDWWSEDGAAKYNVYLAKAWAKLGIYGADSMDPGDSEVLE